jgi:hypothetical protein
MRRVVLSPHTPAQESVRISPKQHSHRGQRGKYRTNRTFMPHFLARRRMRSGCWVQQPLGFYLGCYYRRSNRRSDAKRVSCLTRCCAISKLAARFNPKRLTAFEHAKDVERLENILKALRTEAKTVQKLYRPLSVGCPTRPDNDPITWYARPLYATVKFLHMG